jgi:hypothetical protein
LDHRVDVPGDDGESGLLGYPGEVHHEAFGRLQAEGLVFEIAVASNHDHGSETGG